MTRGSGKTTVLLAVGTTVAGGMPVFLVGALFALMQDDLDAPSWVLGVVVASYWVVAAAVSSVTGAIIAAWGSSITTIVSISGAVVSLFGTAVLTPTWPALVAWACLGGAANALGHPASNHLMSQRVAGSRLATAFGVKQSAVPFAAFLAGLTVPIVAVAASWKWGFGAAAVFGLVLLCVFVLVARRRPEGRGRSKSNPSVKLSGQLRRYLLMLSVATTLGAAAASAVSAYAVTAGIQRGMPDALAGIVLSAGSLLGAVLRILSGRIADRTQGRVAISLTAALLLTGAIGSAIMAVDATWALAVGIVLVLGPGWGWTGLTHYVVTRVSGPAGPTATGLVQTGSYLGSGGGPLLFGIAFTLLAPGPGHSLVWLVLCVAQLVAALAAALLIRLPPPAKASSESW